MTIVVRATTEVLFVDPIGTKLSSVCQNLHYCGVSQSVSTHASELRGA